MWERVVSAIVFIFQNICCAECFLAQYVRQKVASWRSKQKKVSKICAEIRNKIESYLKKFHSSFIHVWLRVCICDFVIACAFLSDHSFPCDILNHPLDHPKFRFWHVWTNWTNQNFFFDRPNCHQICDLQNIVVENIFRKNDIVSYSHT